MAVLPPAESPPEELLLPLLVPWREVPPDEVVDAEEEVLEEDVAAAVVPVGE